MVIMESQQQHRSVLQAAFHRFGVLPHALPDQAGALVELGAAWADYVVAYERTRQEGYNALEDPEFGDVDSLLQRLEQACLDSPADGGIDLAAVDDDRWSPDATSWPSTSRQRPKAPHGIAWLPSRPAFANVATDLYIWTGRSFTELRRHGLAVADLFLIAHLDPAAIARRHDYGTVLRLEVPEGIAVDPSAHEDALPAVVSIRVREASDTLLIPLAQLPLVTIAAAYELDGDGEFGATHPGPHELPVSVEDAEHGVRGLPNEVVYWPDSRRRGSVEGFLALPSDRSLLTERHNRFPGWLPMFRERPHLPAGFYLVRVTVSRRRAIDIQATVAQLESIEVLRADLRAFGGLDLVLPEREFSSTVVSGIYTTGQSTPDHLLSGQSLTQVLEAASNLPIRDDVLVA